MKFTIEASDRVVGLDEDGTPSICRLFEGTAENGAQVRFLVAHCAVNNLSTGFELVGEYFHRLDEDTIAKVKRGEFLVQDSPSELITPPDRGSA